MSLNEITMEKYGTVTVSVYKDKDNCPCFLIQSDNDNVANIVEIIEDSLCMY